MLVEFLAADLSHLPPCQSTPEEPRLPHMRWELQHMNLIPDEAKDMFSQPWAQAGELSLPYGLGGAY